MNHHAVFYGRGARGRVTPPPIDLHKAQPTGAEGLKTVGRTQLGNIDPHFGCSPHDGRAFRYSDRHAVYGESDKIGGDARRGSEIAFSFDDSFQHDGSSRPSAATPPRPAAKPKSSGKCCSADSTGYGAMAPRAHNDPPSMVSQRSRSSSTCCSRLPGSAAIRSRVSTPRTEPIRQGVHFPQDSMAQNSIA